LSGPPYERVRAHAIARIATSGLLALVLLTLLWETVLAPLRPGGTWLALKALPLAVLVPGVLRGHRKTRQIATLVLPWYVGEGLVRAVTEHGRAVIVAGLSAGLAAVTFGALLVWLRRETKP
jgi:uncharacterized membrane protein